MNEQKNKGKDPMEDFFKEICKEMKEETKRVKRLIGDGKLQLHGKGGEMYELPKQRNDLSNNKS